MHLAQARRKRQGKLFAPVRRKQSKEQVFLHLRAPDGKVYCPKLSLCDGELVVDSTTAGKMDVRRRPCS